ncbi:DNAJ heat shock N-terminal domain-containing protein [Prunus dulcis]|uniref:DNAJ heat shock N-terminal domain-containing protein n=1 Tax=Prunus dulcis TaxID=3755 RepID=A0A4Y1R5X7_PRUDU|nr:DNAJ heat shock N-terminal domain-containing protein [Prunus dulcis]
MGRSRAEPQAILQGLFNDFPNVGNDLKQLLEMIDGGQAVDIKGISERSLIKHLRKLFLALNLKQNDGVFLLPSNVRPTLEVVGLMIQTSLEPKSGLNEMHPKQLDEEHRQVAGESNRTVPCMEDDDTGPKEASIKNQVL